MEIRAALPADRDELAAFAAPLQQRPDRHCAYLGADADTIAAEMVAEDDDWTSATAIAEHRGAVVGWLMGSCDPEVGRVWWFGPFIDTGDGGDSGDTGDCEGGCDADRWPLVADTLYDAAARRVPAAITSEEIAVDDRNRVTRHWAARRGFAEATASVVLRRTGAVAEPPSDRWLIRPARPDDRATIGGLHDELFPEAHLTGRALVDDIRAGQVRLVAEADGNAVGYVAVERQADGSGYVDFLGVDPAARRRGLGGDLVLAALAALNGLGCGQVHLTVREDNSSARSVYARAGFVEERLLRPLRRRRT